MRKTTTSVFYAKPSSDNITILVDRENNHHCVIRHKRGTFVTGFPESWEETDFVPAGSSEMKTVFQIKKG